MNKQNLPRAGVYSPYFEMLGGGERYLFQIARCLNNFYQVDMFSESSVRDKVFDRFHINLDKAGFIPPEEIFQQHKLNKYKTIRKYDLFFYMTDGSLFFPLAKKNFLIIQSPAHIPSNSILNRLKLRGWKIICYSSFIKKVIERRLNLPAFELPPSINAKKLACPWSDKQNIILSVGRFFQSPLHDKKHQHLIKAFQRNYHKEFRQWQLVIAGGLTEKSGIERLHELKSLIKGYPIRLVVDASYEKLSKLYQQAKIYWHATGYGQDEAIHPEKMEHFGITTLEAMAGGAVPVVYNAGGQRDIVTENLDGFWWKDDTELITGTVALIKDEKRMQKMSQQAVRRAAYFGDDKFYEKLEKIIL